MLQTTRPDDVLAFWFGSGAEYGKAQKRWFEKTPPSTPRSARHFLGAVRDARRQPRMARRRRRDASRAIIVLDQFPRQMFRGNARAFAADPLALEAAHLALARGYDRELLPVEKLFVYLPFEHSEALADQLRACELTEPLGAFAETTTSTATPARTATSSQRFGRFPHRNAILGRVSTPEESEFLKQPGSGF